MVLDAAPDLHVVAEAADGIEAVDTDRDLVEACRAALRGEAFLHPPTAARGQVG